MAQGGTGGITEVSRSFATAGTNPNCLVNNGHGHATSNDMPTQTPTPFHACAPEQKKQSTFGNYKFTQKKDSVDAIN